MLKYFIQLLIILISTDSFSCPAQIAKTTAYYLPDAEKICGEYGTQCEKFMSEVSMQGSGRLNLNEIIRRTGEIEAIDSCMTTRGSGLNCLVPYISVAADSRLYEKGDIIHMPAMKGQKVRLANGQAIKHPGYFIVHDVGGGIVGPGRFDFFTIDENLHQINNSFGYRARPEMRMYSLETCSENKKFEIVKPDTAEYTYAAKEIKKVSGLVNQLLLTE